MTFSSINTPKILATVSVSRIMSSMSNFCRLEMLCRKGIKKSPFRFISINRELIYFKPSRETFLVLYSFAELFRLYFHL